MKKSGFFRDKRGQVTIFIILGILIVVGIISVYLLIAKPKAEVGAMENPQGFMENCIKKQLEMILPTVLAQGGVLSVDKSREKSVLYQDKYVKYLCYSEEKKTLCTINTPLLKSLIEEEIKKATTSGVEKCFDDLRKDFSSYDYSESDLDYSISISPNLLIATANKKIVVKKDGNSQEFNSFSYEAPSSIFNFILLTNDILVDEVGCVCGQEACRADVLHLSLLNPDFEISVFVAGSGEKVYTIKNIITQQEFKFAVRNCLY